MKQNKNLKKAAILAFWLICWQAAAVLIHNPIYFAGPYETVKELLLRLNSRDFLLSVSGSIFRIAGGFFIASACGYLLAFLAYFFPFWADVLSPLMQLLKSVPVAAVTVILLLWWGSRHLVLCISFMVVFPNIYQSMLTGLGQTDQKLLEMAKVFRFKRSDVFLWLYRPAYLPHLSSALSFSLGLAFKSGIAAEIIGLPNKSIGEQLYRDKIYLNTPGVFAWIVVILFLSAVSEKFLTALLKALKKFPTPVPSRNLVPAGSGAQKYGFSAIRRQKHSSPDSDKHPHKISDMDSSDHGLPGKDLQKYKRSTSYAQTHNIITADANSTAGFLNETHGYFTRMIQKSYDGHRILNTSIRLGIGKIYHLSGPSGSGKTTLLHILAGLTKTDDGGTGNVPRIDLCMVFQEDRLIPQANALRNLAVAGCQGDYAEELAEILPPDRLLLPVNNLSGGEKRRIAIARAVLSHADFLLMDEPFNGLDPETKAHTAQWIKEHQDGRTILVVSHDEEDIALLNAESLRLSDGIII